LRPGFGPRKGASESVREKKGNTGGEKKMLKPVVSRRGEKRLKAPRLLDLVERRGDVSECRGARKKRTSGRWGKRLSS